ncbi:MAG: GntR family transcriptional regulator [Pseudolabrys sp.]|nr:GntR family transcriptional regulator [Pseudolabrys sp.]MDP2298963.1 GntR family transcriptional regulator [Pseudolabrys sp.]
MAQTDIAETVGERTYRRIRSDIIFGRLAPGQRLRLERLSTQYETSIATLRELLNRLLVEGLIVAEGQRGFEVTPVSADQWNEIAQMRELLECHALRQSFENGDVEWEGRVVAAHHKLATLERKLLAGDRSETETWKRYDWEFHHALISCCGSRALLDAHSAIFDKYLRYQIIAVVFRGEAAAREHRELLEAALKRDWQSANALLVSHIRDCVSHSLKTGALAS